MTRPGNLAFLGLALTTVACGPTRPDPREAHLAREMSFIQTGVDVQAEAQAVSRALQGAGLRVLVERSAPGMRALGAASAHFARTAVRVITARGVVEAEDAQRDDVLAPGRVHLLEEVPSKLESLPLVGWVRVDEGATLGCARLRVIDRHGRPSRVKVQPAALFGTACVGGLGRHEGQLWGSLVWPSLTAASTPSVEVPLAPVRGKLDDPGPVTALALAEREGWLGEARAERLGQLDAHREFALRHAFAVELAGLALLAGESAESQRAAYTQHAGAPAAGFEQTLWAETVTLIERGWAAHAALCDVDDPTAGPCPAPPVPVPEDFEGSSAGPKRAPAEPEANDVLQEPVHGQKAQEEELTR